ncbi:uncharacterized protein V1516DRAFT_679269 [Lipomyces oligophaga]|uniref:uncharacterized protein n=1 Tax=Lipomyces oligophaga TaxID=45792 RepID=UPI0034CDE6CC
MSRASKITLGLVSLSAVGVIYGVHYIQELEQSNMRQGVIKDVERQRVKEERMVELQLQQALERELEAEQPVDRRKPNYPS